MSQTYFFGSSDNFPGNIFPEKLHHYCIKTSNWRGRGYIPHLGQAKASEIAKKKLFWRCGNSFILAEVVSVERE